MSEPSTKQMSKALLSGFVKLGFTEFAVTDFRFCGIVDSKASYEMHRKKEKGFFGLRYFEEIGAPGHPIPDYKTRCICGTKIATNAYVVHAPTSKIVVIGKDCCENFVVKIEPFRCCFKDCKRKTRNYKTGLCSLHQREKKKRPEAVEQAVGNDEDGDEENKQGTVPFSVRKYMKTNTTPEPEKVNLLQVINSIVVSSCICCGAPTKKLAFKYCLNCVRNAQFKSCQSCSKNMLKTSVYDNCFLCFTRDREEI